MSLIAYENIFRHICNSKYSIFSQIIGLTYGEFNSYYWENIRYGDVDEKIK